MNRRSATVFVDALLIMLMVLVLLPHKPELDIEDDARAGDLVVQIWWTECSRTDVDLWVKSPGDRPVGYSRLRGVHVSLLRDDVGHDEGCERWELASSRTLTDGEWIVNVHLYGDIGEHAPIPVRVSIWYRTTGSVKRPIWSGSVDLVRIGQELTAARWSMDRGALTPGSLHHSPIALRAAASGGPHQ